MFSIQMFRNVQTEDLMFVVVCLGACGHTLVKTNRRINKACMSYWAHCLYRTGTGLFLCSFFLPAGIIVVIGSVELIETSAGHTLCPTLLRGSFMETILQHSFLEPQCYPPRFSPSLPSWSHSRYSSTDTAESIFSHAPLPPWTLHYGSLAFTCCGLVHWVSLVDTWL